MSTEQADRTARNVLELVEARRQIAAVRALCDFPDEHLPGGRRAVSISALREAIEGQPAAQALDPEEEAK